VSREKGLDVAVRALPSLADLNLVLAVVGDGPERRSVEAAARKLGVQHRVHWCGVVSQAATAFRAFDALLCSSRTEGTPVVLLEAMDAGVPIVATAVGGVPDLLGKHTALLAAPENPEALAVALRDVCLRPASAQRRSAVARDRLERNGDVHRWVRAYDDVYRAAMRVARMRQ
jgi:glycosyltransferase involved in cell wall biosynthesis